MFLEQADMAKFLKLSILLVVTFSLSSLLYRFAHFLQNKKLHVAVKIMQKKHEPQRMILEQQILYQLKGKPEFPQLVILNYYHPQKRATCLLQYGSGTFEDYMFIVMELLGQSLSEMRKRNEGKK